MEIMLHRVEKTLPARLPDAQEQVEVQSERLEYVNERLNTIYDLQQNTVWTRWRRPSANREEYREKLNAIITQRRTYTCLATAMRPSP